MGDPITTAALLKAVPYVAAVGGTIWESLFPDEVLHSVRAISVSRPCCESR